jgi:hypothetical protein
VKRGALAFAAIATGLLTVTFSVAAVASWDAFQAQGAKFLPIRRGSGVTTLDHTAGLGALALLMGLVCAGSIGAFMSADNPSDTAESTDSGGDPDDGPSWTCAGCGEQNPANFEECWKCQRNRPERP